MSWLRGYASTGNERQKIENRGAGGGGRKKNKEEDEEERTGKLCYTVRYFHYINTEYMTSMPVSTEILK